MYLLNTRRRKHKHLTVLRSYFESHAEGNSWAQVTWPLPHPHEMRDIRDCATVPMATREAGDCSWQYVCMGWGVCHKECHKDCLRSARTRSSQASQTFWRASFQEFLFEVACRFVMRPSWPDAGPLPAGHRKLGECSCSLVFSGWALQMPWMTSRSQKVRFHMGPEGRLMFLGIGNPAPEGRASLLSCAKRGSWPAYTQNHRI